MSIGNKAVDLDDLLKNLGPLGAYTVFKYALLIFPGFLSGLFGLAYNFEAMDIIYRCEVPECEVLNSTLWLEYAIPKEKDNFSKCTVYQYNNHTSDKCSEEAFNASVIHECNTYVYSDQDSIVKDFDLGCQNWKRTLIGTVHNAGYFIALPLTGLISDRFGRTIAISIASFMNGIFGMTRSFSTSYNMMVVLEFLETALGAGHYTSAFVLAMESVIPERRAFISTLINVVHVFGILTLTALAWWLQNWRTLLRIVFSVAFIPSFYFILLKESPRWLITKGRYEEAKAILIHAAEINKTNLTENMRNSINLISKMHDVNKVNIGDDSSESIEQEKKYCSLFWRVIRSKTIMTRLFICSYMWISASFLYYGLLINSIFLVGNKYVNFMLTAIVEIPANIVVFLLLDRLGRRRIIPISFLLSGCMCITLSLLPKDQDTLSVILYITGKFFSTIVYSSIYIYISEVFPTDVRQTLLSFCSTMGRVGSVLAPMTPLLTFYYENLPAVIFGCIALLACVVTLALPETINVTLPDNVEEAEKISRRTI